MFYFLVNIAFAGRYGFHASQYSLRVWDPVQETYVLVGSKRGEHVFIFDFDIGSFAMGDSSGSIIGTWRIVKNYEKSRGSRLTCYDSVPRELMVCASNGVEGSLWLYTEPKAGAYQNLLVYTDLVAREL